MYMCVWYELTNEIQMNRGKKNDIGGFTDDVLCVCVSVRRIFTFLCKLPAKQNIIIVSVHHRSSRFCSAHQCDMRYAFGALFLLNVALRFVCADHPLRSAQAAASPAA